MRRTSRGFTLIELLVVVAIIGIVAAIAIPNLLNAISRGRQRRSMAEIRAVALAVMVYGTDHMFVPKVADGTVDDILPFLFPTYLRRNIVMDGWQQKLLYGGEGLDYTIRSVGSDGAAQTAPPLGVTTSFAADIIYSNGTFVQWPDGAQNP